MPKNLEPEVVSDTLLLTSFIPINDVLNETVRNGNVNDSVVYAEPSDLITEPVEIKPRVVVEEMPEFPGGNTALLKFISENIKYPAEAQNNSIQGRVSLKFVVNPDGSVGRIEIILGIDPLLDEEAIRVVRSLPKFIPGKQGGVAVPVWFSLPVRFKLENK